VEVSDDGKIAVVCNYGTRENPGNTLSVYNISQGRLMSTIDLGQHTFPHGMQWVQGTPHLLVTAEGTNSLLLVDVLTQEIIFSWDTGEELSHMVAASTDFSRAFVPSLRTGNVTVIDLQSGEILGRVFSGEGAEGIDVRPGGKEVWVTNRAENTVSVIDTQTLELIDKVPVGDFPIRAKFSPDGQWLLVSNARSGDVTVIDAEGRHLHTTIKLTPPDDHEADTTRYFSDFEATPVPIGITVPDNNKAYVANTRSDVVSVIDLQAFEVSREFRAGREPDGINFSPVYPGDR
jgi:YVTN family beta-propeller protein